MEEKQGQTLDIVTPSPLRFCLYICRVRTLGSEPQRVEKQAWRGASGPLLDEPSFDVDCSIVPAVGF